MSPKRMNLLLCVYVSMLGNLHSIQAQVTVQIGNGNNSGGLYLPVMGSTTVSGCGTCWITSYRSDAIWTQSELSVAGVPNGAKIISVEFYKRNSGIYIVPIIQQLYMANSTDSVLVNGTLWSDILSTHVMVDSINPFNVPVAEGWVAWSIPQFTYTGASLKIAAEVTILPPVHPSSSGGISWMAVSPIVPYKVVGGEGAGTAPTVLITVAGDPRWARPNIRITFIPPVQCPAPILPLISNVTSNSAAINWRTVNGASGYQYLVSTDSIPPASGNSTLDTSCVATGLAATTKYYVHLRTKCDTSYSAWLRTSFTTLGCATPSTISVNLIESEADVNWSAIIGAMGYQYIVSTNSTAPLSGNAVSTNNIHISGLSGVTSYYLHVRTDCGTGGFSSWKTITFNTSCFKPLPFLVAGSNMIAGTASISWNKLSGTTSYEYAILTRAGPPTGSSLAQTSDSNVRLSGLVPGLRYYFHVRSHCKNGMSDWSTIEFHPGGVEVFPNPARDKVTIKVHGQIPNDLLFIYDMQGKIYRKIQLTGNTVNVDISGFSTGMYLVKYGTYEGYVTRMLKQ